MPAKTAKQQRWAGVCGHSDNPPAGCPSKKVAREFAHKGYKRKRGGMPRKDSNGYY